MELGLSRAELATRAGLPRERIRKLETGGNVTVETLTKVVAQLPNLRTLNLEGVEVKIGGVDAAELREAVETLVEAGRRLLVLLQGAGAAAPAARPAREPVGATRVEPVLHITPELEARLRRMEAEIHAVREEDDH